MRLTIVSGLSGSGKTVALHALEDEGFYCTDNLHLGLLPSFVHKLASPELRRYEDVAVSIDARSGVEELGQFEQIAQEIRASGIPVEILFLQAELDSLIQRFSETRRKHPLTRPGLPLVEAIDLERRLLAPVAEQADLIIDTTHTNVHEVSDLIRERVRGAKASPLSLLFQSFGFKHGVPLDSDFVFDVRCLPNPNWEPALRDLNGLDETVEAYLERSEAVASMYTMIESFLQAWIPAFERENRSYLSISLGCTGGRHRSVYMAERLSRHFRQGRGYSVSTRHREIA